MIATRTAIATVLAMGVAVGGLACSSDTRRFSQADNSDAAANDDDQTGAKDASGQDPDPEDGGKSDDPKDSGHSDDPKDSGQPAADTGSIDGDAGTTPTPDAGTGAPSCDEDKDCDDGNVCNGEETCASGFCSSGNNADNGTKCELADQSANTLCIDGNCTASECGDGILDENNDEKCDDGNIIAGDGCEEGCVFTCENDDQCNDSNICNGDEKCDLATHQCVAGSNVSNDTSCGDGRQCNDGVCRPIGCGDEIVAGEEQCDDGNDDEQDGCRSDCTWTCESNDQCDDGNACTGQETCEITSHTCKAGEAPKCDPKDECHEATCDPEVGCRERLIDADGDLHASTDLGKCGSDCNDKDKTIYEGATELCDNKDNDCDGKVDEVTATWYADCDGDGFAPAKGQTAVVCDRPDFPPSCPDGLAKKWTSRPPTTAASTDCWDQDANVKPRPNGEDSGSWWSKAIAGRAASVDFDYNCDEKETRRYGWVGKSPTCIKRGIILPPIGTTLVDGQEGVAMQRSSAQPIDCFGSSGYSSILTPACGKSSTWSFCATNILTGECFRNTSTKRVQQCR